MTAQIPHFCLQKVRNLTEIWRSITTFSLTSHMMILENLISFTSHSESWLLLGLRLSFSVTVRVWVRVAVCVDMKPLKVISRDSALKVELV